jgi:hypothetical protein
MVVKRRRGWVVSRKKGEKAQGCQGVARGWLVRLEQLADELAKRREREGQFPGEREARQVGNLRWW